MASNHLTLATSKDIINTSFSSAEYFEADCTFIQFFIRIKNHLIFLWIHLVIVSSFAQVKPISGQVLNELGTPLAGVNIIEKGTTSGTQSDIQGNYTLEVNIGTVITFSFLGYKSTEVIVGVSNIINITLEQEVAMLDEVVIIGVAGATSRKKLSVTVAKVTSKDLENIPTTSAASALQGKIPGVAITNFGQPGQGATILLRGSTNFYGSQEPLILVDGIIVENGLQDLNIDDIESFEVVKGASASSLYGSRAGNGVIAITTKKGKGEKVSVTIKSELGFSNLIKEVDLNKSHIFELADDWEDFMGQYTKYEGATYPSDYNGSNYQNVTGGRVFSPDGYSDNPYGVYYNYQKLFFRTGVDKTFYASLATASNNTNVFFSAENLKSEGIYKDTKGYERFATRLNVDFNINSWLNFSVKSNYIKRIDYTPGNDFLLQSLTFAEPDVNLRAPNFDGQPYLFVPNVWVPTITNPLYKLYNSKPQTQGNTFLGAFNANIRLANWINVDTEYTLETSNSRFESFLGTNTLTRGGTQETLYSKYDTGSLTKSSTYSLSQKVQFTANFQKSWEQLNLKGKLSYLIEDFHSEAFTGRGTNLIYQGVISLDNFDPENTFTSSSYSDQRAQNVFAIFNLDYKDKIIFDAMYRMDGSSLFGSEKRWNPYYRISGAYRISEDLENESVDELKVHTAFGTAGQRPGFNWQYDRINLNEGSLSTDRIQANPNLLPSETSEFEIGLSGRFFNRFNLEAIYSTAKTKNQFMLIDLFAPANNGQNKRWDNIGAIDFKTLEVSLKTEIIKKDKLNWNMFFAFATTSNEITRLDVSPRLVGPGSIFYIKEGLEFGTMFGRKFVTSLDEMSGQLPAGRTMDDYIINRDGLVVDASAVGTFNERAIIKLAEDGSPAFEEIGNQTPDFTLGISSNFNYNNFNLYMLWDIKKGGDIYNDGGQVIMRDNRLKIADQANVSDMEKKTFLYYQSLYNFAQTSSFWVEDGSYTRLREASLFYTFNKDQLKRIFNETFDSIKLGITGRNIITLTDYSGFDPEVQTYSVSTQQYFAVDSMGYPVYSSYNLSLTFRF